MIVSETHKFIFVKLPKTAGTTIVSHIEKLSNHSLRNPRKGDHEKLSEILEYNTAYQKYFKFSFVRNPWDLRVSRYFYLRNIEIPYNKRKGLKTDTSALDLSFEEWCECGSWFPDKQGGQFGYLVDENGNMKVDFIGRYETLQKDFNTICDKLNISRHQLSCKNKSNHKHYTEYYSEHTKKIIQKNYAKDIEYFGYKFGE
jgi:hypothetical protein